MKAIMFVSAWFLAAASGLAQGTVYFANFVPDGLGSPPLVNAPVYDVDGSTALAGSGFLAQLYAAPSGNSLFPVSFPVPFGTGGYFFGEDFFVPGAPVGSTAVVQVVAWRASDGATFGQAVHPGGHVGTSMVLTVGPPLGGGLPPLPGAFLIGLQSFSLHEVVPEPTALGLGLVGSLVFGLRRCVKAS